MSSGSTTTAETMHDGTPTEEEPPDFHRGIRFWLIIATLCPMTAISALEMTVITTSLPTIAHVLSLQDSYTWVIHAFFLTSTVAQPLFGQLANVFGRRHITIVILAIFMLGSGICGAANSAVVLIAGRTVQGLGSGAIAMMVDIIISDLVPLRQRGVYIAYVMVANLIGFAIGPWIGGLIVGHISWRWVFYINLPVGGLSIVMVFLFLQVQHKKQIGVANKLRRIDYAGNAILVAATVSSLYALAYGGNRHSWSSWPILLPLLLGILGFVAFMLFEGSGLTHDPVMPPHLFANRTSASGFAISFLTSALLSWVLFFLPVYFQSVRGSSPELSGLQTAIIAVSAAPASLVAVLLLARFGRYKPLHGLGLMVTTIGVGLLALLDADSPTAWWAIFIAILGAGGGFVLNVLLPACQAGIDERDQAATTATWSFLRTFGNVWGVAIPSAIFNNGFADLLGHISDAGARDVLSGGRAYEFGPTRLLREFDSHVQQEIIDIYVQSLRRVWQAATVFAGFSFLLVFFEKEIPLRTQIDTDYGLQGSKEERGQG